MQFRNGNRVKQAPIASNGIEQRPERDTAGDLGDRIIGAMYLVGVVGMIIWMALLFYHDAYPSRAPNYAGANWSSPPVLPTEGATQYVSHLDVSTDGTLRVHDSITVRNTAHGDNIQHGIHLELGAGFRPQVNQGTAWHHYLARSWGQASHLSFKQFPAHHLGSGLARCT